jgi:hypothetical protein
LTVNVAPPIETVPERATPVLAAADTETLPLPVPLAPAVTVNHEAFEFAVHVHEEVDAVTVTLAVPPTAARGAADGAIVTLHGGGADCVTVTVPPATVNEPERSPPLFAETV